MVLARTLIVFTTHKVSGVWCKWHFKTNQGIKTLSNEEVGKMPANGAQQDLVDAIDHGDFPSWAVKVQIMSETDARTYNINPFNLTKIWPHKDYPLIEIGTLELNKNVNNYFSETEQVAFAPSNFVPGINASPDKMLQGRLLAYQDAHRYRVGVNVNQIPVNAAKCPVNHYQRGGAFAGMGCPVGHNSGESSYTNAASTTSASNFYPNDRAENGAPTPVAYVAVPPMPILEQAWIKAYGQSEEDYHSQAGDLFRIMNDSQKSQLFGNIAGGLSQANESIQARMLAQFAKADPAYAEGVKKAIEALK